jgi:lysozyme family protein
VVYLPLENASDVMLERPAPPAGRSKGPSQSDALSNIEAKVAALEPVALLHRIVALQDSVADDDTAMSDEVARLFQAYQNEVASAISRDEAPAPDFDALKKEYSALYQSCAIRPEHKGEVAWYVKKLNDYRTRYEKVGGELGIPWWFVGITHALEGSFNFKGHLHNGDPLSARTVQVPKGRPKKWNPPNDWESSAVDALTMKGFATQTDWSIECALYRFEAYNGWGYRGRGVNTPYLWSYSKHYTKGKFVKDRKYDSSAVSKQCGAAVMLKALGV